MTVKRTLVGVGAAVLAALASDAAMPTLSASDRPFSFVVLGDLHVSRPEYASLRIARAIAASLTNVQPAVAFVCQTGDLAHGEGAGHKQLSPGEMSEELSAAVSGLTEAFRLPLFVAAGNHDKHAGGKAYGDVVLPLLSRQLGASVTRAYYAFRYGSACFLFLDYGDYSERGTSMDYAAQRLFLEQALAEARATPGVCHVFAFGHFPLWPVARPGFGSRRFTESVEPALARSPVDAFFCGHTHNTGAWVRRVAGAPLTQIMGVALDANTSLTPMEEVRTLLIPREELSYGWGVLSGPPNGHYLVRVEGPRVRVQLRSGSEVLREFAWQEPGKIEDVAAPPPRPRATVTEAELRQALSAALVFTPWAERRAAFDVRVNGEQVGSAQLEPMPQWAAFASEMRVPVPRESLAALKLDSEVVLENPGRALFGIGNLRLEAKLADGRTVRSRVFDKFLFSAKKEEAAAQGCGTYGWSIIPTAVAVEAQLGVPLGPARLSFAQRGGP